MVNSFILQIMNMFKMFYTSEMYDRCCISRNSSIRMMIVSDGDRTNRICDSNISIHHYSIIVLRNIVIKESALQEDVLDTSVRLDILTKFFRKFIFFISKE